ncbi:hypothetical protein GCM10009665_26220 [Kitasatospora nipponensis]|uniref:Uncharacterized protein n=1 Tax=Kitasatospora nipponensis TaxID=258049 RepID=A0ABP4GWD5_9ACTN
MAVKRRVGIVLAISTLMAGWGPLGAAEAAAPPGAPYRQCPAVGAAPSCQILLVVNPDGTVGVQADGAVGPYDGSDDTLVGIVNNSRKPVTAVTVTGPGSGLSGFDGDGICSGAYGSWAGSAGCPYGPTGYEGPGTSFVTSPALPDSAEVDFAHGLAPGASAYFALEGALASAKLTARKGPLMFTVAGALPVRTAEQGNQSQFTHDQSPRGAVCDPYFLRRAQQNGRATATSFANRGMPASAALLNHFLDGTGTPIDFPNGSPVANDLLSNGDFKSLDKSVQAEVKKQLDNGKNTVQLDRDTLTRVALYYPLELLFGFRGTQGLTVTGSGSVVDGNYVGSITYVVQDSYGFPEGDHLLGLGDQMRYLQTVCGAPQTPGGAHWFADSITVKVPFSLPVKE